MSTGRILGLVCASGLLAVDCATPRFGWRTYVEPPLPKVTYSEVQPKADPRPLHLEVDFQAWGELESTRLKREVEILGKTSQILIGSGLFSEFTLAENVDRLSIVVRRVEHIGSGMAQLFTTSATAGLIGSKLTTEFIFTATYIPVGKEPVKKNYRGAVHMLFGIRPEPEGLQEVLSPSEALDKVVEGIILSLLRDLHNDGYL